MSVTRLAISTIIWNRPSAETSPFHFSHPPLAGSVQTREMTILKLAYDATFGKNYNTEVLMKKLFLFTVLLLISFFNGSNAQETQKQQILFLNVKIFDGKSDKLITGKDVLVEGNRIIKIAPKIKTNRLVKIVNGQGKVLMPGLIDAHTHLMVTKPFDEAIYTYEPTYIASLATEAARRMLMRGFTTARDAGGPVMGLKRAIDEGIVPGPRIFPSNAFISQTGGHGDFDLSMTYLSPYFAGQLDKAYLFGWTITADGVPEVRKAVREVLRSGASQIKIMASGSITGAHDPLDVVEYAPEEMRAIVEEAEKWGTYAMAHAYSDEAVRTAIEAGVKSIEHGLMASPETLKLMKKKGVWLSTQCLNYSKNVEDFGVEMPANVAAKFNEAKKSAERVYKLAKKYGLKLAWGTDTFGSLEVQDTESQEFIARSKYFSNIEILRQVTSLNGELLSLSSKRSPYPDGRLGVVEEGAYADLLIVDDNPLQDITLLAKPEESIQFIMKDGTIYKNTLNPKKD